MFEIKPGYREFCALAKKGNIIPVYAEVMADVLTPVSAYMNISKKQKYAFMLESVVGGERAARYSFLGMDPYAIFRSKGREYEFNGEKFQGDPLSAIDKIFKNFKVAGGEELPPFIGGGVGYFGYDVIRHIENIPETAVDDLGFPDIIFMMIDKLLIFDHLKHKIKIVCCARLDDEKKSLKDTYKSVCDSIEEIFTILRAPVKMPSATATQGKKRSPVKFTTNMTKKQYVKMIEAAKEHIRAGDIFQVVLGQRFSAKVDFPPMDIYRMLRSLNPSPYMFFLEMDEVKLIGASPEILVTLRDGEAVVRPIAGTRPRPADRTKEKAVIEDLLADEKERAEHIMLVDLGRNDLGRIAEPGTVEVTDLMSIEKYSHVIHIVSNVTSRLKKGNSPMDVLRATFPAGTVSGAPKVRAMEIIDEFEPTSRGPYAGTSGYMSFTGHMDLCITIRTVFMKDGVAHIQAGGGIVADSVPENEYEESLNKARAMRLAIQYASEGVL